MIALRIEFLAGRFHANPWDRGTNDGEVDWPPAPWRLLRALVAGWYRDGQQERETFITILDRLTEPPMYLLPRATAGHTRHYMPLGTAKNGKLDTTLVLDSFITLEKGHEHVATAYVIWPHVDLTEHQQSFLNRCCALIGYLGRAESWCAVSLAQPPVESTHEIIDLASRSKKEGIVVSRLAAGPSLRGDGLFTALVESTSSMRKAGRLMPVGTAWAEYRVPTDFLMVREQFYRRERAQPVFGPTVLRFGLERGQHSPKPAITDAVVFSELLRAAAIKRLSSREGEPATLRLAGEMEGGLKREGHDHPYFLPFDAEGRGEIDGIDVWLPFGCTQPEYLALTTIPELREHVFYKDNFPLTLLGRIRRTRASTWRSATPVVLERFPKIRGPQDNKRIVDGIEEQLAEMIRRLTDVSAKVEIWKPGQGIERQHGGHIRVDAFRRVRTRKFSPPLPTVGARIHFDRPVEGPIVLGRLSHFGLGRFEPVAAEDIAFEK